MQIKQRIKQLEQSKEFKDWWKENTHLFLTHAFIMPNAEGHGDWQFGYYDEQTEKMTSFLTDEEETKISPPTEVFKKPGTKIKQLNIEKVNTDLKQALETTEELRQKEYEQEGKERTIAILQHLDIGVVWNITILTRTHKTLNIKIDAETGKIKEQSLGSLISTEY